MESIAEVPVHRFSTADYDRLVDTGALAEVRVELLDGLLVDMSPQGPEHAFMIRALIRLFAQRTDVLDVQLPLACADGWTPEPDVALIEPAKQGRHPHTAALVVEVVVCAHAEALRKRRGYALARVARFWIIDVPARSVNVFSDPAGDNYETRTSLTGDALLDPQVPAIEPFTVDQLFELAYGPATEMRPQSTR